MKIIEFKIGQIMQKDKLKIGLNKTFLKTDV
jgi:hypothetical protein